MTEPHTPDTGHSIPTATETTTPTPHAGGPRSEGVQERAEEGISSPKRAKADFAPRPVVSSANDDDEIPPVPAGIGPRGGALWQHVQEDSTFDPRETNLLIEVCRILDTIDALSESIAGDGIMVAGSQGQLVLNAAVGELRQQQQSYARLVTMLNLDELQGATAILSTTRVKAQTAANARWSSQRRANRG